MYNDLEKKRIVPAAVSIGLAVMLLISSGFVNGYQLSTDNSQAKRLYEKGLSLVEEENFELALEQFRQAIEVDPMFMQAHFRYIDVSRSLGRSKRVIEEYRLKSEQNPQSARAKYFYGRAVEDLAEKMRVYRATLELDPTLFWAQYGIGGI